MARPLLSMSIVQLEALFEERQGDGRVMRDLSEELKHRSSQRAQKLAGRVRERVNILGGGSSQRTETTSYGVETTARPDGPRRPLPRPESAAASSDVPTCPKCGAAMVLRTAKNGPNAGNKFWGCSGFKDGCRGTRDYEGTVATGHGNGEAVPAAHGTVDSSSEMTAAELPVIWSDGANRQGWVCEYGAVGAVPGVLQGEITLDRRSQRCLSQCLIQSRRDRPRQGSQHQRLVSALLAKFLQRGRTPLATLAAEESLLGSVGFADAVTDLSLSSDQMGWEFHPGIPHAINAQSIAAACAVKKDFVLDSMLDVAPAGGLVETDEERTFLLRWVPTNLGGTAGHWFIPQAPLDALLEAAGKQTSGARRLDFLFSHPQAATLAIEIDGPEHNISSDDSRDEELKSIGISTIRVPNDEIRAGLGPNLDAIRVHCLDALVVPQIDEAMSRCADLIVNCSVAAKVQFAIARAVGYGWLTPGATWHLNLEGSVVEARAAVLDLLHLLSMFDALYSGESTPSRCDFTIAGNREESLIRNSAGGWESYGTEAIDSAERLTLVVDRCGSPFAALEGAGDADLIVRPAYFPVELAGEHTFESGRVPINTDDEQADRGLRIALHQVFRKADFRPMQAVALRQVLRQQDSVVLLPTGAGKSLIYQLAGLLMPGVTLVVDPIVALIEDQVEGLEAYGIDRAAPIASSLSTPEEKRQLLVRVERGEYHFVLHSPERLQSPAFRSALRALAETSLINLAVIDEAHCVSEWGHDFRPAYLNLARNLRRLGSDREDVPPPLLALTGTASRAVLRDVLTELDIDRNRSDAVIRPESFNRPELQFDIVRTTPREDALAVLRGVMNGLPARFGLPRTDFYRACGRDTESGIVFVPTVNARIHGVTDAAQAVRTATATDVVVFSGGPPRGLNGATWEITKRENAKAFKKNVAPALVATKAFGMGIDKPNIRYTVHFGIPSSLERLYQEAGRAGRDRKPAHSVLIFSEYDEARSDRLLDPQIDLLTLRDLYKRMAGDRVIDDDVTRALFFHLSAYEGSQRELQEVKEILEKLPDLTGSGRVEIPFPPEAEERKGTEKAILRLLKVGVIDDYEVEFGGRKFIVHHNQFDLQMSKQLLRDYVEAAQPALTRSFAQKLDKIQQGSARELALLLAHTFIQFTYDIIERSRRRMIQECVLLSRQARNDADIRTRLLDYLQEGIGAESLDRLLEDPAVSLMTWCELLDHVQTAIDANELRGNCIRALESYPNHPGLLMVRGVAESLCSDRDDRVCMQGIESAVVSAVDSYGLDQLQIKAALERLFVLAGTRGHELGPPLVLASLNLTESIPWLGVDGILEAAAEIDDTSIAAIMATWRLGRLSRHLERAAELACDHFEPVA